ncbi:MAG TPA: UbiA family prenyltransferase [Stellaceae bacterium]|nr:UbiA family prenyltransferase [Stellaceae bacterium]
MRASSLDFRDAAAAAAHSRKDTTSVRPEDDDPWRSLPLCVDLDGTLLRTDVLYEQLLFAATHWSLLRRLPGWKRQGIARLKQELAVAVPLDVATLPYDSAVVDYLRQQRARGRRLVLATAADRRVAKAVSGHLGLFDEVIASDGRENLRGHAKAARLCALFGERQFCYVGSDDSDLAIWHKAAGAVFANARRAIVHAVRQRTTVEARIGTVRSRIATFIRALRPHQWSKNLLVFVPMLAAGALTDGSGWLAALFMFAAFCCAASGIYLINDLTDLTADRRHPRKRYRPFASGDLPVIYGVIAAPLLIVAGSLLALRNGSDATAIIGLYALLSLLYSLKLKEKPLVDIFGLAALYSIRLFGGGIASNHPVSLWLMMFSSFLFLSLACTKRDAEMIAAPPGRLRRRGYRAGDRRMLEMMGVGASFVSSMVLGLYIQDDGNAGQWSHPQWLWATIPLLLFWLCRLWLATTRGYMLDDPIVYASRDWVSRGVAVLLAIVYGLAFAPF